MARPKVAPSLRFWARVDKLGLRQPHMKTRCWLWQGKPGPNGYGHISVNKVPQLTHRFSWRINVGLIPKDGLVLHQCDVRLCVRPSHLYVGTHADNVEDKMARDRHPRDRKGGAKGEAHWNRKLTNFKVRIIRRAVRRTRRELAAQFGVSVFTIKLIQLGKIWRHVW